MRGIDSFLPLQVAVHQWSDRRRLIHTPLFPGYLFVRLAQTSIDRIAILRTNGVVRFVGSRGVGIPIPDNEIEVLPTLLKSGITLSPSPYLCVGKQVRIRGGCLNGVSGILLGVNGDQSLVVSVNLIQRSVAMRIEGFQVEED